MKSHDCHVFMQCLLPIAFADLPKTVLKPLSDLSHFFRTLCSSTIDTEDLKVLQDNIPVILCSLEKVFPPGFFDVMEHLPIHLPYEAEMCGPVQYRWMYPFERCMGVFKRTVKNRARVEGCICEAFLTKETSFFCSYYFADDVICNRSKVGRNDDGGAPTSSAAVFSIFNMPGRASGAQKTVYLTGQERKAAHSVVLLNCDEVAPIYEKFQQQFQGLDEDGGAFIAWFQQYVQNNCSDNDNLMSLSWGPLTVATTSPMYFVNGYKFHTSQYASRQITNNSGVCVKGDSNDGTTTDWYGVVKQIISVQYAHGPGPALSVTLFGCDWFDPTRHGTRYNDHSNIIEVNESRRYKGSDIFIVPQIAKQVYYVKYPGAISQTTGWKAVIVTKPRGRVELNDKTVYDAYQMPDSSIPPVRVNEYEAPVLLTNSLLEQDMEIVDPATNVVQDEASEGDEDEEEEDEEEDEFDDEESESDEENNNLYQSLSDSD